MSKIVFFGIPAHGHTNPTLGVVRELVSRGHQVWYYSYHLMREKIESAGATFVPCDDYDMELRLDAKDSARLGKDLAFSAKILVDTTLALDDRVCREMETLKPDCIIADSMALWGKAVAQKLSIPFVSSTTTFAFNRHSAKIMKQSVGELLKMILSMLRTAKQVRRLQDKGYPVKNILDIIGNDDNTHTIVYTSPEFQPSSETFSDNYAFVGPSIRPAVENIEKKRETLIYISMGTVNNDMLPFYKQCLSAFADTEYQVILSVGDLVSLEDFGELPENISVYSHVDQIAVLQQADVFVSHCGMNSVSESLYFAVPLVMLPQTAEQGGVAERVRQLGAGVKLDKTDATSLRQAVNILLTDSSYQQNARMISEGFRRCSGAKGAADQILQACKDSV
ncbi:MAG: glucosyltransferase [Ruminococcaceae bacterium]|nr:glucosyltransferase [Oscillospiraceae bacterium]